VFENRVLMEVSGRKRNYVTRGWRRGKMKSFIISTHHHQSEEEEDVSSYWMTLRKRQDTGSRNRNY
jgi:hypothetical protein